MLIKTVNDSTEQQESQAVGHATAPLNRGGYAEVGERIEAQDLAGKRLHALEQSMPTQPAYIQEQYNYAPAQEGDTIQAITMLRPFKSQGNHAAIIKLPKTQLLFELQTKGAPTPEELQKVFQLEFKDTAEAQQKIPLQDLLKVEEGRYLVEWNLELPKNFQKGQKAEINVLNNTFELTYYPMTQEMATPEQATRTIGTFETWSHDNLWLQRAPEQLQELLPNFQFSDQKGRVKANLTELVAAIENSTDFTEPLALEALEQQDLKTLRSSKTRIYNQKNALENLLEDSSRYDELLEDMPQNYEGAQPDSTFGASYTAIVERNNALQATLKQHIARHEQGLIQVETVYEKAKVQEAMSPELRASNDTIQALVVQIDAQLATLKEQTASFSEKDQSFEAWQVELATLERELDRLQEQWTTTFQQLETAVTAFEAQMKGQPLSPLYQRWKKFQYPQLEQYPETMAWSIDQIKEEATPPQEAVAYTGGDGALEYQPEENTVTKSEQERFEVEGKKLSFRTPDVPLYADGIAPEDINQGAVGDCYLLACLATLSQGESQALITNAIVDKGDHYEVTLYKNNVPIKVGVDKAMLYLTKEVEGVYVIDRYLAADPTKELWVAVIEKAYAKIEGGGEEADYSKIEGNTTQYAFSVLLGAKQQSPNRLYLDAQGNLSEETTERAFKNPLPLQQTSAEEVAALAQACAAANYKMTVASPDTFDGVEDLTHDYVVKVDADNYMHLNHAYAVIGVDANEIKLLNPHGDSAGVGRQTYSPALIELAANLEAGLKQLEKDLKASDSKRFSDQTKLAMQNALTPFPFKNEDDMSKGGYNDVNLKKINKAWNRLLSKCEEEDGEWKIDKKKAKGTIEKLLKFKEEFIESSFRRGFGTATSLKIDALQKFSYQALAGAFSQLSIFKV